MQKKNSAALKLGLSAIAALALTVGGVAPAFAATIPVGAGQVEPIEIGGNGTEEGYNYDKWHIGSSAGDEAVGNASFGFDDAAGITLFPRSVTGVSTATQLFKGNHIADIPKATPLNADAFQAFLAGLSTQVASGNVHFQIAGNYQANGEATPRWTTLRPSAPHGTASALDATLGVWEGTGSAFTGQFLIADLIDEMSENGGTFVLYGVGVNTDSDVPAVVSTITFGGDTYDFTTAAAPTPGAATPPTKIETAA